METRLGQAAPLVVAMEAILAACPLVAEMEAVAEGPCVGLWLLVLPWRSLSLQASPGGLLVPVDCPVLSVWPWRAFLSCFVLSCLFSPGGLLIPPHFPREILGGVVRVPAVGARPRGPRPRPPKTICHGLQSSLHRHGFQSSQLHHGPCLSVPLGRSPSCVLVRICPEGPPERPPPLPDGTVKARDEPFGRGELCQGSVVCHVFPPLVSIFGLFPVLVSCHYELSMFQLCLSR